MSREVLSRSLAYLRGSKARGYVYAVDAVERAGATRRTFTFEGSGATREAAIDDAMGAALEWVGAAEGVKP